MAGLDLSQVSSNWKKLQAQLQTTKKADPQAQSNGVKRKRNEETKKPLSAFKKAKLEDKKAGKGDRRRKMGMDQSQPAESRDRAKLVREHGISASDVTAAYGTASEGGIRRADDEINGGRHTKHKAGKYVALDCEMVGTGPPPHADNVLARASLVNFHGEQIYDTYVLPPPGVKVEDYRTHVSGIKPGHLKPGHARTFLEVQKEVANLLQDRILVGHALSNDLRVLLLSHPKRDLRDTSRHPKFRVESMGKPPALRDLVRRELGLKIQTGEHSSVEDARAAMMLYKKEKLGFEEENRRHFGTRRKVEKQAVLPVTKGEASDEEDGDDAAEEDDLDLLDGEGDGLEEDGGDANGQGAGTSKAKKKRKKKKRTKRH